MQLNKIFTQSYCVLEICSNIYKNIFFILSRKVLATVCASLTEVNLSQWGEVIFKEAFLYSQKKSSMFALPQN